MVEESETAGIQTCPCNSTCTEGNPYICNMNMQFLDASWLHWTTTTSLSLPESAWRHKAKYPQGVSQKKLAQPGRSAVKVATKPSQCWQWANDFQWEESYGRLISGADRPFPLPCTVLQWGIQLILFFLMRWLLSRQTTVERMVFWHSFHVTIIYIIAQGPSLKPWYFKAWISGVSGAYITLSLEKWK